MFSIAVILIHMIITWIVPHHADEEIFYDNCSSLAGWTKTDMSDAELSETNMSEVTLSNFECTSQLCFQIDANNAITSSSISVQNYQNITLQYSIKPFWLEHNDFCKVYYTQSNNDWTLLAQYGSNMNNKWQNRIIQSLPLTNNSDHIKLRFSVTKNSNETDSCFIDEIYLFGTQITQSPQPTTDDLQPIMVIGIILISSIGFLFMICFFKLLSEQVESCVITVMTFISNGKSNQVPSMSVGGANLSFLEEASRLAEEEKQRDKMDKLEVDRLRNFNFALTKRFSDTNPTSSTLNLDEANEKLKYHVSGLTAETPADGLPNFNWSDR